MEFERLKKYTVFITYLFETSTVDGYSKSIHCNYINSVVIETNNILIHEIKLNFMDIDDFKFISNNTDSGLGVTIHGIKGLVQIVQHTFGVTPKPKSNEWRIVTGLTEQIGGYVSGQYITSGNLFNTLFKIPLFNYETCAFYNLDYLDYPIQSENNRLCFGEETIFFGNVKTDIRADVYTTDLTLNLPLNEFNSSTNETWDSLSPVYLSEIGIYDSDKNLVAIGKLNNPIPKNSLISRTIQFSVDF